MTTILLADDHVLVRHGIAALLQAQAGWTVVAEAGDGKEAVQLAEHLQPDVAVLDIEMPRMNGIDAAREIRRVSRETRIVALSMYGDAHYQERMFSAGAAAYVLKTDAVDTLVKSIRLALLGDKLFTPVNAPRHAVAAARSARLDREVLSAREQEVLRRLAVGERTAEVADALGVGVKTVETYRLRLMAKLGIDNVPGLVRFAIRAGIVSPER